MKKALLWGWKWKLADLTNKPVQISGSFDMESLALAHTGHLTSTGLAADLSESLHAARPQVALHCQAKFCTSTVQSANGNIKPGCSTALLPVKLLEFLLAALHRDAPRPELRTDFGILPSVDLVEKSRQTSEQSLWMCSDSFGASQRKRGVMFIAWWQFTKALCISENKNSNIPCLLTSHMDCIVIGLQGHSLPSCQVVPFGLERSHLSTHCVWGIGSLVVITVGYSPNHIDTQFSPDTYYWSCGQDRNKTRHCVYLKPRDDNKIPP